MERKTIKLTKRQKYIFELFDRDDQLRLTHIYGRELWFYADAGDLVDDDAIRVIKGTKFLEDHPKAPNRWRVHVAKGKKRF